MITGLSWLLLGRTGADLGLCRAANLLNSVLSFLALLTAYSVSLVETVSLKSVFGLKLFGVVEGVVDEGKATATATAKVSSQAKGEDHIRGGLVHASQLLANLLLRDGRSVWMDDIDDHLLSVEQSVGHELARSDGARICHGGNGFQGGVLVHKVINTGRGMWARRTQTTRFRRKRSQLHAYNYFHWKLEQPQRGGGAKGDIHRQRTATD